MKNLTMIISFLMFVGFGSHSFASKGGASIVTGDTKQAEAAKKEKTIVGKKIDQAKGIVNKAVEKVKPALNVKSSTSSGSVTLTKIWSKNASEKAILKEFITEKPKNELAQEIVQSYLALAPSALLKPSQVKNVISSWSLEGQKGFLQKLTLALTIVSSKGVDADTAFKDAFGEQLEEFCRSCGGC